jgi:hypothetical protein
MLSGSAREKSGAEIVPHDRINAEMNPDNVWEKREMDPETGTRTLLHFSIHNSSILHSFVIIPDIRPKNVPAW